MKIKLEVGDRERSLIEVDRDPLTGALSIVANARPVVQLAGNSLAAGFGLKKTRRYEFAVGGTEKHQVVVEHGFPAFLAGFRPQTYRVFRDGQMVLETRGY